MTNYNKNLKPIAGQQKPLTEEEIKEQRLRAAAQKYNAIVEGVIFSAVNGAGADLTKEAADTIYESARHIGNRYLEDLLGVKLNAPAK